MYRRDRGEKPLIVGRGAVAVGKGISGVVGLFIKKNGLTFCHFEQNEDTIEFFGARVVYDKMLPCLIQWACWAVRNIAHVLGCIINGGVGGYQWHSDKGIIGGKEEVKGKCGENEDLWRKETGKGDKNCVSAEVLALFGGVVLVGWEVVCW